MIRLIMVFIAPYLIGSSSYASPRTAFVHLFEWKWTDIANECTEFLGPKGFSAVQISPPNEHALVDGYPWYQRYQPVSYQLKSRSGNREEFINMVSKCKLAGVDIYVDAVINHMTGDVEKEMKNKGSGGTIYGRYNYPGLYKESDFHRCGRNGNDDIQNYNDRWEVQTCELVNLADLDTGSLHVQNKISNYLQKLINLGVSGFRIDAAKHISAKELKPILKKLKDSPYIFQEVIDQGGEVVKAKEYFSTGDITEFKYSLDIGRIFRTGKLAWLNTKNKLGEEWNYMPSQKAVVFTDNHDNQRGHGGGGDIVTHSDQRLYELANVFMLAWPYGYPKIMSSYRFESHKQGPPSDKQGRTKSIYGKSGMGCLPKDEFMNAHEGWICEHRWKALSNMVAFRNETSGNFFITDWWANGNNQIAFGRGDKGFVVINKESNNLNRIFSTSLPAGKYCNVIEGVKDKNSKCEAQFIEVNAQGKINVLLKGNSALAIHIGQKQP